MVCLPDWFVCVLVGLVVCRFGYYLMSFSVCGLVVVHVWVVVVLVVAICWLGFVVMVFG